MEGVGGAEDEGVESVVEVVVVVVIAVAGCCGGDGGGGVDDASSDVCPFWSIMVVWVREVDVDWRRAIWR